MGSQAEGSEELLKCSTQQMTRGRIENDDDEVDGRRRLQLKLGEEGEKVDGIWVLA